MGNQCCKENIEFKLETQKIMKVIQKNEVLKSNQIFLQVYDIENHVGREIEINLRFLKFDGLSQLNLFNSLYLCGWANDTKYDYAGSSFIRIDPMYQPAIVTYLISTYHCHYYPSMTHFKKEYILIIGGKDSLKCEIFNLKSCKWKEIPDLPEERYNGLLACDENTSSVYLFGGFNYTTMKIHTSILKLSLKNGLRWDTIVVTSEYALLLSKMNACICRVDRNSVFIIGGISNEEESCNDIIECKFSGTGKNPFILENKSKLSSRPKFNQISLACESNNYFYMIDESANVHKISIFDQKHSLTSFFATNEEYQSI